MPWNSWHRAGSNDLRAHWEDLADWLNRFLSVVVVLILGFFSLIYVYSSRQISCYSPNNLSDFRLEYIHEQCWAHVVGDHEKYSHGPMFATPSNVMLSIVGFSIPYLLWRHFAETLIDSAIKLIMKRLELALDKLDDKIDRHTNEAARYVIQSITFIDVLSTTTQLSGPVAQTKTRITTQITFVTRMARSKMRIGIPWLRFVVKALYLINVIMQWIYTNQMINYDYKRRVFRKCQLQVSLYGTQELSCTLLGDVFLYHGYYTFNSWLWYVMLFTIAVFFLWIGYTIWLSCRRMRWIKQRLIRAHSCIPTEEHHSDQAHPSCAECGLVVGDHTFIVEARDFVRLISQTDAVVLLELIDHRVGSLVTDQILLKSWHIYIGRRGFAKPVASKPGQPHEIQSMLMGDESAE
ncbi:unnamed protein product [Echinostoma caproni]|uniref:Innexin n=1 Tax=Echinostoma caproni TaxID=27848 RepID=A0A183B7H1_9TREM|nr:unnamed protein product [Echinostoma caproni]